MELNLTPAFFWPTIGLLTMWPVCSGSAGGAAGAAAAGAVAIGAAGCVGAIIIIGAVAVPGAPALTMRTLPSASVISSSEMFD